MAFELPPAPARYSRQNENQTRRLIEQAFTGLFARMTALEADAAAGGTPEPQGPTASFSVSIAGRVVTFTDQSVAGDAAIVSWSWDFGDSSTPSSSQNPSHTYDSVATFTVVLTVTDANSEVDTFSRQVTTEQLAGVHLPVGFMSFGSGGSSGTVGMGPGLDTVGPRCTACMYVPNVSTIGADIDTARANGITLILNFAGNKSTYETTVGGVVTLDMQKYKNNVSAFGPSNLSFADRTKVAEAIRDRVILNYVVDEPNLTNAQNPNVPDISVAATNEMALWHKSVWAGYSPLTFVRVPAATMRDGWLGTNPSNTFWTGVDYCWSQYTLRHGRGGPQGDPWSTPDDPRDVLAAERLIANTLNMGVAVSLNLWAGGHGVNSPLGVNAKWDTGNNGGTLGYVVGDRDADQAQVITTLTTSTKSLACSPDWLRKHAELLAQDLDLPFFLYWQHTRVGSPADEFINYYQRSDYEEAFDDAINFGLSRPAFNGYRTAK